MTRYDFHNGRVMELIVSNTAPQFPSRFHCIAGIRYRHHPDLAKKWISQKKAIRRSQVSRKFYDDAIEVLLKFCVDAIKVL